MQTQRRRLPVEGELAIKIGSGIQPNTHSNYDSFNRVRGSSSRVTPNSVSSDQRPVIMDVERLHK